MRDEQGRINSYKDNKKIDFCIRLYIAKDSFIKVFKGDILKGFNKYIEDIEVNISKNTLDHIDIIKKSNVYLAEKLGVHKDTIRKQKQLIREQFKPIIEANRNFLELFI